MAKKLGKLKLNVRTQETPMAHFLTASGTFQDGDLVVNRHGLRVISQTMPAVSHVQDAAFTLEDLETVKDIGKGSGGVVQLARHKWTGQFFAVKVIHLNIEETVRKQIVRELRINQGLQNPFVVICYHAFYNNGIISIVLEYMDGGSLADVLKSCHTISEPLLAVICRQVLKGLVYLHQERHVIHRDLKPSNLLVNHKGEVKITDFGVSAVLTSSMGQRHTFIGTYKYMSGEESRDHDGLSSLVSGQYHAAANFYITAYEQQQTSLKESSVMKALQSIICKVHLFEGRNISRYHVIYTTGMGVFDIPEELMPERVSGNTHTYDSDVWSLGLVMLECALGHFPYLPPLQSEGWLNFYELLEAIVWQPPPLASRDQFSPEFCSFISGCLQKEPAYRIPAVELLKHPFLTKYENQSNSQLADFISHWLPIDATG